MLYCSLKRIRVYIIVCLIEKISMMLQFELTNNYTYNLYQNLTNFNQNLLSIKNGELFTVTYPGR